MSELQKLFEEAVAKYAKAKLEGQELTLCQEAAADVHAFAERYAAEIRAAERASLRTGEQLSDGVELGRLQERARWKAAARDAIKWLTTFLGYSDAYASQTQKAIDALAALLKDGE